MDISSHNHEKQESPIHFYLLDIYFFLQPPFLIYKLFINIRPLTIHICLPHLYEFITQYDLFSYIQKYLDISIAWFYTAMNYFSVEFRNIFNTWYMLNIFYFHFEKQRITLLSCIVSLVQFRNDTKLFYDSRIAAFILLSFN